MNLSRLSRLLWLALGLTVFEHSTNMAQAQPIDPVVSATSVTYNTSVVGTNGAPYQSKQEFSGSATLNWILGQPSGATSSSSTIQYFWFYPCPWVAYSTNWSSSITSWPATGGTGTVTTTSFISSPMTNGTFITTGTAAAYVPPTNNWEYAFGDVQVMTYPTYYPTATNKTTKSANAVLRLETNGGTNYGPSSIFKITVSASERAMVVTTNWVNPNYYYLTTNLGSRPIPPGNINCGLGVFGGNGVLYTNLSNNASYLVTPTLPAQYTNYVFNISAQRIIIHISMRTIGPITPYTTNGSPVGPFYYASLTNWFGQTNLGVGPTTQPGYAKSISNLIELTAAVPDDPIFNSGWEWHRDGNGKEYYWSVGGALIDILDSIAPTNSPAPPAGGSDDPLVLGSIFTTTSPDAARTLFDHDAPRLITAGPNVNANYADAWSNSIFAKRYNARQWLTWNGSLVSNVVEWHSQVTVKKTAPPFLAPWTRVGPNEIGEGLLPSINFTVTEASQY